MRPSKLEPLMETCLAAASGCACQGLRSAARAVSRFYEGMLAPTGLTATQFSILVAVNVGGAVPLSGLAERLVLDRTSLYRALRPLERRGHLRVVPGRDRREKAALLAAGGKRLLAEALPRWQAAQSRLLAACGAEEWERLAAGLTRMVSAVEAAADNAATSRGVPD